MAAIYDYNPERDKFFHDTEQEDLVFLFKETRRGGIDRFQEVRYHFTREMMLTVFKFVFFICEDFASQTSYM